MAYRMFRSFVSPFLLGVALLHSSTVEAGSFFQPLQCNANIRSTSCTKWSESNFDLSQKVTILCGSCITMDESGELVLAEGLDIEGKLVFPSDGQALHITTPFIFVQGELHVEKLLSPIIPQRNHKLQVHLVGSQDITFVSHPQQQELKCAGAGCNVGIKPIVVAGGKLDISGMHTSCPTWSRLASIDNEPAPVLSNAVVTPQSLAGCSATIVVETFASGNAPDWDGLGAPTTAVVIDGTESFFRVQDRTSSTQGPRIFLPSVNCLQANVPYIVKYRYRMTSTDDQTEFGVPYLKMVHNSDWRSPDLVFPRGSIGKVEAGVWQDVQIAMTFSESMVDASLTNSLTLYISPFDDGSAIVDLDYFQLELAQLGEAMSASCDTLLYKEKSATVFPFYPKSGLLNSVVEDDGNEFLRNEYRTSRYHPPLQHQLPLDCMLNGAVYELQARVRVHSTTNIAVAFNIWTEGVEGNGIEEYAVANCPPSSNDWVTCTAMFTLPFDMNQVSQAQIVALVPDDTAIVDFDDLSFNHDPSQSRSKTLLLEDNIKSCWGPGAQLVVTSHTLQYEDSQLATIESVDPSTGKITLVNAIHAPITIKDDSQTAVEVALLTRNIHLTAAEGPVLIGGHFIVMHTQVRQNIVGLEIEGFGQQGKLGRYPLHFHMCFSSYGSLVAKNTVRDSHQRGYVVHATHDLVISENVAYNTKGHVFMLEDGGEQNNTFFRNLGALSHGVEKRISEAESDNNPSTFWVTNPVNTLVENVAAGSSFSGFWFEVKTRVRGPSAAYFPPDMNPSTLPLQLFSGNVAHSNANGLQTYPQTGYKPPVRAIFDNLKSFRNREAGVFFHAGGLLGIDNSYFSDNREHAIKIDADHSDIIYNTMIVGASPAYRAVVERYGLSAYKWPQKALCEQGGHPMVGVELDSYHVGGDKTGTSLQNVEFSGFDPHRCPGSAAIVTGDYNVEFFDPRNSLEQVTVTDDSPLINLCSTAEKQVSIHDMDGTFSGRPGFIVSDSDAMKADPSCVTLEGTCAAICPGVCLRSMQILVPSYIRKGSLQLEIEGTTSEGDPINPVVIKDFETKPLLDPTSMSSHRRLFLALPAGGSYTGQFTESGQVIWPGGDGGYADLSYEDEPGECGPIFEELSIQIPARECNELIINGDMGDSIATGNINRWWHIGGSTSVVAVVGGAGGTKFSLLTANDASTGGRWVGMAQYLDTRCIEEGFKYIFEASIKLTQSDGTPFVCNMDGYPEDPKSCPKAALRSRNALSDDEWDWTIVATMQGNDQDWNTLRGVFSVSSFDASASQVVVYINGVPAGIGIQLDQVSLVRTSSPSGGQVISPTASLSASPVDYPAESDPSLPVFENTSACKWNQDGSVRCATDEQEEATIVSTLPHAGVDNDTIELTVEFLDRHLSGTAYQPHLVLFFAPEDAQLSALTTSDNTYQAFESAVVASAREKIYYNPDNPSVLANTWFHFNAHGSDGISTMSSSSPYRMLTGGKLRIRRHGGFVSAFHSQDGASFVQIGSSIELDAKFRNASLKVGMRIKREWKHEYDMTLLPSIVAGGTVELTPEPIPEPSSAAAFDDTNCDSSGTVSFSNGAVTMENSPYDVSVLLSHGTFESDVTLTVEMLIRDDFGAGYQAGLVLFFTTSDTDFVDSALHVNSNGYASFEQYVVGTLKDKVHATMTHTWMTLHAKDSSGTTIYQPGGGTYKNSAGFLRLERRGGSIFAHHSQSGIHFQQVGSAVELPDGLKTAPLKLGIRALNNYNSCKMTFRPIVEEPSLRRTVF